MRYKCAVLTPWKAHVMQLWVSITGSSGSWRMSLAWALRRPVEIANLGTISDCAGPEPTDVLSSWGSKCSRNTVSRWGGLTPRFASSAHRAAADKRAALLTPQQFLRSCRKYCLQKWLQLTAEARAGWWPCGRGAAGSWGSFLQCSSGPGLCLAPRRQVKE